MADDDPSDNPYAPSTLYEPTVRKAIVLLPHDIAARGTIFWPQRRRAFLLAYGVTARDLIGLSQPAVITILCIFLITSALDHWAPLAFLGVCVMLVAAYLLWRRWQAEARARDEQAALADVTFERTITDQGIVTRRGAASELAPWSSYMLYRVEHELLLLVRERPRSFQIFPCEHFANQQDWQLFQSAVQHYVRQA